MHLNYRGVNPKWVNALFVEVIVVIGQKMNKDVDLYVTLKSNIVK
jgi:hypothetical protein